MASQSPDGPLQAAIFALLTTDARMTAAFGGAPMIYDEGSVPSNPQGQITARFPYVTIGGDQIVPKTPQISKDAYAKVEVWSRATDYGELKRIAGACEDVLSTYLPIAGFNTVTWNFHGTMYRLEPDRVTRRAILAIDYIIATLVPLS